MDSTSPGWYGKLACLGDFAGRRLPAEWVAKCDAWLSSAIEGSKQELGDRWLDAYLSAPVLRFVWAPRVMDDAWWFGVLMASCDNVGRYFPLLIAQSRNPPPQDRIAFDHLELWYEQIERAALATLSDVGASVEALEAALAEAAPWPTASTPTGVGILSDPGNSQMTIRKATGISSFVNAWAAREMMMNLTSRSLWWYREPGGEDKVEIHDGLPDGHGFAHLIDSASRHGVAAKASNG